MEKVNVYDWDKTIFPVDSTAAFYRWCIKCFPKVMLALPATVTMLPKYWTKNCTKTQIKERFYGFLRYVPDIDNAVVAFWDEYFPRVNQWYLDHMQPDDIIISASPEFLIGEPAKRLGLRLLASRVDKRTGLTEGENCHGEEKVRRLHEAFPEVEIAEFYSDSQSDAPLARIADKAFLVKGQELLPWITQQS